MEQTLVLLAIAFVTGAFGAVLGVGGGFIAVPALTILLGLPIHVAIGSSITAVIATSSAAALSYIRRGYVNVRLGMLLEIPAAVGAVLGALLAVSLSGDVLRIVFAGVLIYAAISMTRWTPPAAPTEIDAETGGWLTASFQEPTTQAQVVYAPIRTGIGLLFSSLAGAASGMLGVGGGIVKVPLMTSIMFVPARAAMATSSFMIGLTGAASAFIYYSHGFAPPDIAGPTAVGVIIGATVGAKVFRRLKPRLLVFTFIWLLIISAVRMIIEVVT